MARIIVVDDSEDICRLLKRALEKDGHSVTALPDTQELDEKLCKAADLILLDVMMPGEDGVAACGRIRAFTDCPILFLTARGEDEDVLNGLGAGGDDYLTKPFSVLQLRARVEAHLRRERRVPSYRFVSGGLRFDLQAKKVYAGEQELSLTRSEYMLCETLARHPGLVYTREQLLEEVFGFDSDSGEAAVTEHIKNLRGKLASCDSAPIEPVWGMGYRWNSEKA